MLASHSTAYLTNGGGLCSVVVDMPACMVWCASLCGVYSVVWSGGGHASLCGVVCQLVWCLQCSVVWWWTCQSVWGLKYPPLSTITGVIIIP